MLKIFTKLIVLPVMVILIALSFTVSILSKIHYLVAVLVNAIFHNVRSDCFVIATVAKFWNSSVCSCCKLYDIEIVGYHRICHWSNMWSFI